MVDFIDGNGSWCWSSFEQYLPNNIILQIAALHSPSHVKGRDTIFWAHSKHGEFTTSSAYLALSGYNSAAKDRTWRLIWTWKGPQSVRVFLWQAFHAGLKTKAELARRHLLTSSCCDRCGALCEDAMHALRDCPLVKQFWLNIIPISQRQGFFNARFYHWLCSNLADNSRMRDVSSWAVFFGFALWRIWYWRNQFLFNQTKMNCAALLVDVHSRAEETHKLYNSPLVTRSIRINTWISWLPPEWPWCTLNTDGAHKSDGISTAGGLIRDHLGRWISGFGMMIGSCSITVAELWGMYKGLQLAWDSGIRRLKVETDSLCVTQLVARSSVISNEYAPLVQAIKDYLKLDWHVSIAHIYREANFAADYMANLAISLPLGFIVYPNPPLGVRPLLSHDFYGVSYPRSVSL